MNLDTAAIVDGLVKGVRGQRQISSSADFNGVNCRLVEVGAAQIKAAAWTRQLAADFFEFRRAVRAKAATIMQGRTWAAAAVGFGLRRIRMFQDRIPRSLCYFFPSNAGIA